MSKKKYRIKLNDGKIIGPFNQTRFDRQLKGQNLTGDEKYQEFPKGEWRPISELQKEDQNSDHTLYRRIEEIRRDISEEQGEKIDFIDQDLLKKNVEFRADKNMIKELDKDVEENSEGIEELEKTKHNISKAQIKKDSKGAKGFDKTFIRPLSEKEKAELEKLKKKEKLQKEEVKDKEAEENVGPLSVVDKKEVISFDDKTKMVSLKDEEGRIISELRKSERAVQGMEETPIEENGEAIEETDSSGLEKDSTQEGSKGKKKKSPLYLALLTIVLVLAFMEIIDVGSEKKKGLKPIPPKIIFPSKLQFKEAKKSENVERQGDDLYQQGSYSDILKASRLYAKSLGYDFDNRSVLGKLILAYSELYRDSINHYKDSEVLIKLIKIAEKKIPNDINYITGAAIFFYRINRPLSTINIIENFLKINKSSTVKLIRYYMLALFHVGMEKESRQAFEQLKTLEEKEINAYLGMVEYSMSKENFEQADVLFREATTKYPNSMELLVEYCKVLLHKEDFARLLILLNGIKEVSFDRSVYFYSQYLKYMGILSAVQKKQDRAIKFFKKSLRIMENTDLRKKLEDIEADPERQNEFSLFINENKTIRLIQRSDQELIGKKILTKQLLMQSTR